MTAGLHDCLDDQILGMIRLQMRRNEPDLAPEYFERHAGFDTRALNAAADRDAVIAVKSPQQRRLSGAVWPVHDPALTSAHIERDVFEHCVARQER